MEISEGGLAGKIKIEMTPPAEREMRRFIVNAARYGEGRLFASQDWVDPGEIGKAKEFIHGKNGYGAKHVPLGYTFRDAEGRECFLIGDGHHRAAVAIVEGRDLEFTIDADLGVLPNALLINPALAAQKLAVLGVRGFWPFQTFMRKFAEVKFDLNGKKRR